MSNEDNEEEEEYSKIKVYRDQAAGIPLSKEELDIIVDSLKKYGHDEVAQKVLDEMEEFEFIDEESPEEEEFEFIDEESPEEEEFEFYLEDDESVEYFNLETYNEMVRSNIPLLVMFKSTALNDELKRVNLQTISEKVLTV